VIAIAVAALFATGIALLYDGLLPRERESSTSPSPLARGEAWLALFLRLAGEQWTPRQFILLSLLCGLVTALIAQLWLGWMVVSAVAGVLGSLALYLAYVPRAAAHRAAEQAALVEMAAQLRSILGSGNGRSLDVAFIGLAHWGPRALQMEMNLVVWGMRHGQDGLPGALRHFRDRLADPLADQIALACLRAHELGNRNLGPLLDRLVDATRQEQAVRREAASRQSEHRLTAQIIFAVPIVTLIVVRWMSPDFLSMYDTVPGQLLLLGFFGWLLLGYILTLQLGRLPKPPRVMVK